MAARQPTPARAPRRVLALASDHLVIGRGVSRRLPRGGWLAVEKGGIVTFGIPPTEPKTDYGYIRRGGERSARCMKVAAFVEKPDAKTAMRYIAEGLLWNSGNFMFAARGAMSEMVRFEPAMAAAAEEAVAKAKVKVAPRYSSMPRPPSTRRRPSRSTTP